MGLDDPPEPSLPPFFLHRAWRLLLAEEASGRFSPVEVYDRA